MSVAALMNRPCTLLLRSQPGSEDAYGNEESIDSPIATVCELQQSRRDEPVAAGELSDTDWTIYLPADTELNTGDGIVVDGHTYELTGDPWVVRNPRTGVVSHVQASLRRTTGAEVTS